MNRLLIANRGEIAVRIARTARAMGISTVAVFSDPDFRAPHVRAADHAVRIGSGPASESYLRIDALLDAAAKTGCDALHPGYGFLSENAALADAALGAGLIFVGPSGDTIRALGDKAAAKRTMRAANVPVVPGYDGDDLSLATLRSEARRIGFPLLVKATAGGGGRGMRRVDSADELEGALDSARREAAASFGDDRVLLEKLVPAPRHVEFQIFGDSHGNVVHLFERECSVQRRHQKILEESPAPRFSPETRSKMADAAVSAGRAARYVGAGTVEFLVSGDDFFFLEVNTRLQVEHPVTESVTGLDLVEWQLRVARGEPLPLAQNAIASRGHCVEARVYAEDPGKNFLPSLGTIAAWSTPAGPGIRVDSGVEHGQEISPFYDPMLAKVIATGTDRTQAIARLRQALAEFVALGVATNLEFLIAILDHPKYLAGETTTAFLTENFETWRPDDTIPDEIRLALAAESLLPEATAPIPEKPASPWQIEDGFRVAR